MIHVYALTDPVDPPADVTGFDGTPLEVHQEGPVAAVHSPATAGPPETTPEHLWHHLHVGERLLDRVAVLPTRFGTVLHDQDLATLLQANVTVVADALDRVRGCVELGIRAVAAQPAESQETADALAGDPTPQTGPRSGRDYLMARVARERRWREEQERGAGLGTAIDRQLGPLARDRSIAPARSGHVLVASYLVARDAVDDFVDAASRVDEQLDDVHVLCTGPWPPHSFSPALDLSSLTHA